MCLVRGNVLLQLSENKSGIQRGFVLEISVSLKVSLFWSIHPLFIIPALNNIRHSGECGGYLPEDVPEHLLVLKYMASIIQQVFYLNATDLLLQAHPVQRLSIYMYLQVFIRFILDQYFDVGHGSQKMRRAVGCYK